MTNCPDIKTAIALWQESLTGNCLWNTDSKIREYIYHTNGVGDAAYKIAKHCGLNPERSYIFGLLHDYGKIQNEKTTGIAHFIVGYETMMSKGWDDVARICITHSFPCQNINFKNYSQYQIKDLQKAQDIISSLQYDDYDRLIQLCDMFFEGNNIVSIHNRISGICQRYNLNQEQAQGLEESAMQNKKYFNDKYGCDVYNLLNIKE